MNDKIEREWRIIGDPHARVSMGDRMRASDSMRLLLDVAEAAEEILHGCGNHACRVKKPSGMGTNGPCHCAKRIAERLGIPMTKLREHCEPIRDASCLDAGCDIEGREPHKPHCDHAGEHNDT